MVFAGSCLKENCPCRIWINCPNYKREQWKQDRDGDSDGDSGNIAAIHEWYDVVFRVPCCHPDIVANG